MEWTLAHAWLGLALLLALTEMFAAGSMIFLALAAAAVLTALTAFLQVGFYGQLIAMGLFSGLLIPIAVRYLRPRFTPKGVHYGTTGTGVENGLVYHTVKRDFDGATGLTVNGDFYRLRVEPTGETELPAQTPVVFGHFDGTTAIVHFTDTDPHAVHSTREA